jgi:hypothetical protein
LRRFVLGRRTRREALSARCAARLSESATIAPTIGVINATTAGMTRANNMPTRTYCTINAGKVTRQFRTMAMIAAVTISPIKSGVAARRDN